MVLCLLMQRGRKAIGVLFVVLATAHAVDKSDHDAILQGHEFVRVIGLPRDKVRGSKGHSFDGAFTCALAENFEAAADDEVVLAR